MTVSLDELELIRIQARIFQVCFGRILRAHRKNQNKQQWEVSQYLDITPAGLSKHERGSSAMSVSQLAVWALCMDTTPVALCSKAWELQHQLLSDPKTPSKFLTSEELTLADYNEFIGIVDGIVSGWVNEKLARLAESFAKPLKMAEIEAEMAAAFPEESFEDSKAPSKTEDFGGLDPSQFQAGWEDL